MNMFERIEHFTEQHNLIAPKSTLIVGLSGGPDSVFLLHFLHKYAQMHAITLIAAHLDHQWRSNSESDVHFCQTLAHTLNMQFVSKRAQDLPAAIQQRGSQEEIGRRMRRYFLQETLQEHKAQAIALGHHAQDQQETFFIRLIRGTTLNGLTCMKPKDGFYIRPLLEINKEDILAYLHEKNSAYLEDPTNTSPAFLRNRIRHTLLPILDELDSRFDKNFMRTIQHIQQADTFIQKMTAATFTSIAHQKNNTWRVNTQQLLELDPFLCNRIIIYWLITENVSFIASEKMLHEIKRFLHNQKNTSHTLHQTWRIVKQKNYVFIAKL